MKLKLRITPALVIECFDKLNPERKPLNGNVPLCAHCVVTVAAKRALTLGIMDDLYSAAGRVMLDTSDGRHLKTLRNEALRTVMSEFDEMVMSGQLDPKRIPEQEFELELKEG